VFRTAGLPGLRFHDLRSLAATALVAVGTNVKTAKTRLGHSSCRMTLDVYARATSEADKVATDKVGSYLRPKDTQRARQIAERIRLGQQTSSDLHV
jgi:integrase